VDSRSLRGSIGCEISASPEPGALSRRYCGHHGEDEFVGHGSEMTAVCAGG
jgi:hypothetical protein